MMERRKALNGFLPERVVSYEALPAPEEKAFAEFDNGSGNREVSTTMAFAVMLRGLAPRQGDRSARSADNP